MKRIDPKYILGISAPSDLWPKAQGFLRRAGIPVAPRRGLAPPPQSRQIVYNLRRGRR